MTTSKARWFGLFFLSLGVSLIIVDATIVNVAVPSIIDDLKITSSQAQWIQETYTLVFAALLLVFGRLADVYGRRRIFVTGVTVFVLSSLVAAIASSGEFLILARLAQGFGGAMMLPTSLSLLNANFQGRERGIAFAVWGSTIGGTAALGPLLGGWLTSNLSWRWAFGINLPLGIMVAVGTLIYVVESKSSEEVSRPDFVGALLSIVGIGSIVVGLIEGRTYGWLTSITDEYFLGRQWDGISPIPLFFALGIMSLLAFWRYELGLNRAGKTALLDLSLFRIASFRNGNIAAAIVSLGEFGLLFALPLWLQNVLGYSAFGTGAILLALALGSFAASGAAAQMTGKAGPVKVVRLGILLELIGVAAIGLVISSDTSLALLLPGLFVYGIGVGLATAQLTGVVLADVPVDRSGQASGTSSTTRQLGSALGIAILGTVLFTSFGNNFDERLTEMGVAEPGRTELTNLAVATAGSILPVWNQSEETQPLVEAGGEALSHASRNAAFAGAAFLLLGFISTFRLTPTAPFKEQ